MAKSTREPNIMNQTVNWLNWYMPTMLVLLLVIVVVVVQVVAVLIPIYSYSTSMTISLCFVCIYAKRFY